MAHRPLLHELLEQDQEPFNLKTHIANKRSELKNSSPETTLQLRKRRSIIHGTPTKSVDLCKHACFFSFNASPDVRRSPFLEAPSPAKSPNAAAFLHIPSRTAAVLAEAAIRIQKQQRSNPKPYAKSGFGLLGSILKRLADRNRNRKRAIEDSDIVRVYEENEESFRMSCSCSNRRLISADRTVINEDKSSDFEASTSSRVCDFSSGHFRFSLQESASSSGRRTPEFFSPAASPSGRVKQENANCEPRNSENSRGEEEEEEKEQCSPVSVLDPPFDEEEGDFDIDRSYENVQRAKQQLMYRLQRFEKLAELDPVELDRRLLEGSDDDEGDAESNEYDHNVGTSVCQVYRESSLLKYHCRRQSCNNEVVREVEFNYINMMVGLELKEFDVWTKLREQFEDAAAEIELAIYAMLVEELTDDLILG